MTLTSMVTLDSLYQYIAEQHPEEELQFDPSKIRVFTIDIETAAENGFPDIESADQEILAISIKDSSLWSHYCVRCSSFDNKDPMVDYMHFRSEESMLGAFLDYWHRKLSRCNYWMERATVRYAVYCSY